MPLLAGTVALITVVVTLGTCSRLGFGRALAVGLAASIVTASAVGLVLLDRDAFERVGLLRGLLAALIGWTLLVVWLRRRWPARAPEQATSSDPTTRLGVLALLVVLGVGIGIRLDPSPYLHGGQDQGIYVNVGHHIARTGRLRPVDRLLAGKVPGVPAELIHAAHEIGAVPEGSPLAGVREGRWIAGLHIEDASEGRIIPAFFHLLPVWLALGELDFGFARSTWVLVLFAGLAQLGAFAVGRRLGAGEGVILGDRRRGCAVGLIAATALAIHPLDLWISTFTVTENVARAALLGAAALSLEADAAERRGEPGAVLMGALAGLVFAAGAFARGSMLALAIVLALALVVVRREAPRSRAALLITLVVGSTLAAVQAIFHSWPYFFSAAANHFHAPRMQPFQDQAAAWAFAAGLALLITDFGVGSARRRWPRLDRTDRLVQILALLALVAALAALTYRSLDTSDAYDRSQLVATVLLRYCGPVGLALALIGLIGWAAASRHASARQRAWLLLATAIVLITSLKEGIRYEFYYARYLVGDAIPVLVIAAAWALGEGSRRASTRGHPKRAAIGLALVLLAWWTPSLRVLTRPVYWTRDLEHSPEDLAAMFEPVPDDALLFFDSRAPGRWRGYLASPAFLAFGKTVVVYPSDRIVERAVTGGTAVYMISGGWELDDHQRWPDRGPWRTTVIARGQYRARRADVVEGAMPERLVEWGGAWELQQIDPSIWRGTGALSLYPGSRFIAHEQQGRLESVELELRWEPGAFVELLVEPGSLEGCTVAAAIVGAQAQPLPRSVDPTANNVYRFSLPPPPSTLPITSSIALSWHCPDERKSAWRRLSLRWERR